MIGTNWSGFTPGRVRALATVSGSTCRVSDQRLGERGLVGHAPGLDADGHRRDRADQLGVGPTEDGRPVGPGPGAGQAEARLQLRVDHRRAPLHPGVVARADHGEVAGVGPRTEAADGHVGGEVHGGHAVDHGDLVEVVARVAELDRPHRRVQVVGHVGVRVADELLHGVGVARRPGRQERLGLGGDRVLRVVEDAGHHHRGGRGDQHDHDGHDPDHPAPATRRFRPPSTGRIT